MPKVLTFFSEKRKVQNSKCRKTLSSKTPLTGRTEHLYSCLEVRTPQPHCSGPSPPQENRTAEDTADFPKGTAEDTADFREPFFPQNTHL